MAAGTFTQDGRRWEDLSWDDKWEILKQPEPLKHKLKHKLGFKQNFKDTMSILGHALTFGAMFSSDSTLARDAMLINGIDVYRNQQRRAAVQRVDDRAYDETRMRSMAQEIGQSIAQELIAESRRQQAAAAQSRQP